MKARAPKKPTDMDAKTWRWVGEADQILQMWRDDEYDNLKDAIEDARSMLLKPPAGQNARTKKLESMLAKAQRQLLRLTVDEPSMAEYANGLLGAPRRVPKKRATTSKKRSSSTRKTIGPRPRSRPR